MRPLNKNERLLAIALGSCVFLVLNMLAIRAVMTNMRAWKADIRQRKIEVETSRQLLAEKPYWEAREKWVEAHPVPPYDELHSDAKFVDEIQNSLRKANLEFEPPQLYAAVRSGSLAAVDVDLKITGRLEPIVRWLNSIQQPGNYHLVRSFELRRSGNGDKMNLNIRLGRVFRAGELASSP